MDNYKGTMKKILILCLLSLSFSQQHNYSKMSDADKIMLYSEMKKSPVAAGFLEIIPTAGYAYAGKWNKRELLIGAAKTSLITVGLNIVFREQQLMMMGIFSLIGGHIIFLYSIYDVVNQTSTYNKKLYKQIFGKEASNIGVNLYPMHDGAGISLTYSFN